jgi:putative phosphoesterase
VENTGFAKTLFAIALRFPQYENLHLKGRQSPGNYDRGLTSSARQYLERQPLAPRSLVFYDEAVAAGSPPHPHETSIPMQIAILSDTHDQHGHVGTALAILRQQQIDLVLHCGDIEEPATVELFRGLTMHFVFGNCDSDRAGLRQAMADIAAVLHEPFGDLELEGRAIAFLHGDDSRLLRDVANSGHFDFLFHGHTHQAGERQVGPTRVINPGALHRARPKSFAILDLATGTLEPVVLPGTM